MKLAASALQRARIVLVGSGRMGQIRGSLMYSNPKFDMIGVCDVNTLGAQSLGEKYSAASFTSLQEAIDHFGVRGHSEEYYEQVGASGGASVLVSSSGGESSTPIDGIVLCAPTFTHDDVIQEAADYGLPIFVEKPVDETADKIEKLFDICESSGAKLCCGFQRRFDESYVAVAEAVRQGTIGNAISANIFFADHPCPPTEFLLTGGDIFMDLCAHDVDYIRNALNDEVSSVYATGSSSTDELKEVGVFDNATMVMTFKKGTVVTLTMSRSAQYGYDQRVEIFGTDGLVSVGNQHTNSSIIATNNGFIQPKLKHSFPERFNQAFNSELDAFANTVLLNTEWPVSREDCINVQKVADAAKRSSQENRVVHL
jgi:myo-inositol 2-dehydrogenase/D-chiro-inositol 1-dehydrogenase